MTRYREYKDGVLVADYEFLDPAHTLIFPENRKISLCLGLEGAPPALKNMNWTNPRKVSSSE